MKVTVLGSGGQLGFDLLRVFKERFETAGFNREELDITNEVAVKEIFSRHKPDIVLNAAAYTRTKEAETNPQGAFGVNALGALYVGRAAAKVGAVTVYISTDYVFGNEKPSYDEDDEAAPLNVYGLSKLAGEYLTKMANPKYYIVRTSALYGAHRSGKGYNFVTLMLELAREGKSIKVVDDEFTTPTYTLDLSKKIMEIVEKAAPFGTYHITNQGKCSWYEFAQVIFSLTQTDAKLEPIPSSRKEDTISRPHSAVLKNKALFRAGLPLLRSWQTALGAYIDKLG